MYEPKSYERSLLSQCLKVGYEKLEHQLKEFIEQTLPLLISFGEISPTSHEESLLLQISPSTIGRLLAKERTVLKVKRRATTKPGTLLWSKIPIRTFAEWDEKEPGFFELDLVGHCGRNGNG